MPRKKTSQLRRYFDFHRNLLRRYRKNRAEETTLLLKLTKPNAISGERAKDKIELLQFINRTIRKRLYLTILPFVTVLSAAFFTHLFTRVTRTTIAAKILVNEIDFVVARDFDSDVFSDFKKNSASGKVELRACRAEELEANTNDYLLIPYPDSKIVIPQIQIPRQSHVYLEQPFENSLRLSVSTPDTNTSVRLVTSIENASIQGARTSLDTHIIQDERLHTGNISFSKRMNDPNKFALIIDEINHFGLNRIPVDKVFFRDIFEASDSSFSSIQSGIVHLNDTKEDSIVLFNGDKLELAFADHPVPLKITHTKHGIEVQFHATVHKLTTGSESVRYNKLPLRIKELHDKKPWLWLLVSALVTSLLGILKDFL